MLTIRKKLAEQAAAKDKQRGEAPGDPGGSGRGGHRTGRRMSIRSQLLTKGVRVCA